jgi:hypothetical protein
MLVGEGALEEFSEGLAQGENFSEVVTGEVGAGSSAVGAFAANLDDADDAVGGKKSAH